MKTRDVICYYLFDLIIFIEEASRNMLYCILKTKFSLKLEIVE